MSTTRRPRTTEDVRATPRPGAGGRVIRVGNYIIERRLGSGGQADVFLARDVVLRRLVALKVLHRTSETNANVRGLEEARLIATLDHPNIVRVHHVELSEGVWYMAMEYVDGGNLEMRLHRLGALEPVRALRLAATVADALQHAHKIGVLHRDVKPQNLLETRAGVLKLADFGLAGLRGAQDSMENTARPVRLVGTPQYLAPEVWNGEAPSVQTDLYGLGATLFFMLTGQPPFQARNLRDMRQAHASQAIEVPPTVPPAAAAIVRRCMAKRPSERFASAKALFDELDVAVGALTGDRRRPARSQAVTEAQEPILSHSARANADAAVLNMPLFANTREKLSHVLGQSPPIAVFYGPAPDSLKRLIRTVVDQGTRKYFTGARTMINASTASLGARLVEQLHLGHPPVPAWHDRVIGELQPEASGGGALPSLMEIDLRRPLSATEATDLIELGRRAEGKSITFLVTCDPITGQSLMHEIETSGYGYLARSVGMPEMRAGERGQYVRLWTQHATGDRLRWTDDALRLIRHSETFRKRPVDRMVHNAILIAHHAGMKVLTSWAVLGADAHGDYIQNGADVGPPWRTRPTTWPDPPTLEMLIELRRTIDLETE
jgi:serine/threonine protein kinase